MARDRDLRARTMAFAVAVSDFCELLPQGYKGRHVAGQLFRSGTAVASNYRSACRARSLRVEAGELVAIFTQSQKTARANAE